MVNCFQAGMGSPPKARNVEPLDENETKALRNHASLGAHWSMLRDSLKSGRLLRRIQRFFVSRDSNDALTRLQIKTSVAPLLQFGQTRAVDLKSSGLQVSAPPGKSTLRIRMITEELPGKVDGGGGGNRTPVRRFSDEYDYMLSRCFNLAPQAPNGWVSRRYPV